MKFVFTAMLVILGMLGLITSFCGVAFSGNKGYLSGASSLFLPVAACAWFGLIAGAAWYNMPDERVMVEVGLAVVGGLVFLIGRYRSLIGSIFDSPDAAAGTAFTIGASILFLVAFVLFLMRQQTKANSDSQKDEKKK
jgi:hypothetical protein